MAEAAPLKLKLHHHIPAWVPAGGLFHIRIRCDRSQLALMPLTDPGLGRALLKSVTFYHVSRRWWCHLFLLMPDHLHALLAFPPHEGMSRVIGEWKHYQNSQTRLAWQDGYFDHRIRNDRELELKAKYIRDNPVVKNLSASFEEWPWVWTPALQSGPDGPCAPRAASDPAGRRSARPTS